MQKTKRYEREKQKLCTKVNTMYKNAKMKKKENGEHM